MSGRRWLPVLGIVHHRGRRSGRAYATPLGMRPDGGDGFLLPLTFGDESHWYLNLKAAGTGVITYGGRDHTVARSEVLDRALSQVAFPHYERLLFRMVGIKYFVRLHRVD